MILVHSYNTIGMGTSTISRYLIETASKELSQDFVFVLPRIDEFQELRDLGNVRIVWLPCPKGAARYLVRLFVDLAFLPILSLWLRPRSVIVMANYSPVPLWGRKSVLMRHPYLVRMHSERNLSLFRRILEILRRLSFRMTLWSTDTLFVQSDEMKKLVARLYGRVQRVEILANPVIRSRAVTSRGSSTSGVSGGAMALYVSRYYAHKNHEFLIELADRYKKILKSMSFRFVITLDPEKTPECQKILSEIERRQLQELVVNIGERERSELDTFYQQATCLFFPSKAETFGNPLVEAMDAGLPVIVPDVPYAQQICSDAGIYYEQDDLESAFRTLKLVCEDSSLREAHAALGSKRATEFPSLEEWWERVLEEDTESLCRAAGNY